LVFIALEGFSGTGKTSIAKGLEKRGWLRLAESAHAVPKGVPVAERADTFADYSLVGATMVYSSIISKMREKRNIVSEGYLLSDLAYARIRYDLKKSDAFPTLLALTKRMLSAPTMRPDLYVLLLAKSDTISRRQRVKNVRERNPSQFFRTRYYSALAEIHEKVGADNLEQVYTDTKVSTTLEAVVSVMRRKNLVRR